MSRDVEAYDHLPAIEAVMRAWAMPSRKKMRAEVRERMPVLARALDRLVDEGDDEDVPGFVRPFHTHPYLTDRGDDGHAHPRGGGPHRHFVIWSAH